MSDRTLIEAAPTASPAVLPSDAPVSDDMAQPRPRRQFTPLSWDYVKQYVWQAVTIRPGAPPAPGSTGFHRRDWS